MKHIKTFNLFESIDVPKETGKGCIVLFKGKTLPNENNKLYAIFIDGIGFQNRLKKLDEPGELARMVYLDLKNYSYRIMKSETGELKAVKMLFNPQAIQTELKLNKPQTVLNNNKTPLHWLSLKYSNLNSLLTNMKNQILDLKNIEW